MSFLQRAREATDTWLTPPEILKELGRFDLDPCASPEPRPWATADKSISLPEDGLQARWHGRVWINPPYGSQAGKWIGRLREHGCGTALVFARVETVFFQKHVLGGATAILFLAGRLRFCHANGRPAAETAPAPSVLAAYGKEDADKLQRAKLNGYFFLNQKGA